MLSCGGEIQRRFTHGCQQQLRSASCSRQLCHPNSTLLSAGSAPLTRLNLALSDSLTQGFLQAPAHGQRHDAGAEWDAA